MSTSLTCNFSLFLGERLVFSPRYVLIFNDPLVSVPCTLSLWSFNKILEDLSGSSPCTYVDWVCLYVSETLNTCLLGSSRSDRYPPCVHPVLVHYTVFKTFSLTTTLMLGVFKRHTEIDPTDR